MCFDLYTAQKSYTAARTMKRIANTGTKVTPIMTQTPAPSSTPVVLTTYHSL